MPVVKYRFIGTTQTAESRYLFPWLVFSRDNNSSIYSFVNPMHNNENYLMKFSELPVGATIRYQRGGWLLMSREKELFFYNPFTRETIQLADFPGRHELSDISFSSLPTAPDCIVFGIDKYGLGITITIYSIRRGEQEWVVLDHQDSDVPKYPPSRNTPTLFNRVFYSAGYDGTLKNT
ncbi:F-box/kelch-repeat protein At1g57790-like [Papaver somniferum]|uniref:F-box/kelch-repeat protein At1g57790-like n=1 Tax=Papaver somniferum TaxID=3469 RepID=UPI000E6FCA2C|nr:F-box/kelch-repeat protein At1g57790-like [Papaver somniferum]